MPERAHPTDAGLDLKAREDKVVPAGGSAVFDTGVHIQHKGLPRKERRQNQPVGDTAYFDTCA